MRRVSHTRLLARPISYPDNAVVSAALRDFTNTHNRFGEANGLLMNQGSLLPTLAGDTLAALRGPLVSREMSEAMLSPFGRDGLATMFANLRDVAGLALHADGVANALSGHKIMMGAASQASQMMGSSGAAADLVRGMSEITNTGALRSGGSFGIAKSAIDNAAATTGARRDIPAHLSSPIGDKDRDDEDAREEDEQEKDVQDRS